MQYTPFRLFGKGMGLFVIHANLIRRTFRLSTQDLGPYSYCAPNWLLVGLAVAREILDALG